MRKTSIHGKYNASKAALFLYMKYRGEPVTLPEAQAARVASYGYLSPALSLLNR